MCTEKFYEQIEKILFYKALKVIKFYKQYGYEVEDLVAELFIRLLPHQKKLEQEPKLIWMRVSYDLKDIQREEIQKRKRDGQVLDTLRQHFNITVKDCTLENCVRKDEVDNILDHTLLTDLEKHVIYLIFYQGLTQKEVGLLINKSASHMSMIVKDIVDKLQQTVKTLQCS